MMENVLAAIALVLGAILGALVMGYIRRPGGQSSDLAVLQSRLEAAEQQAREQRAEAEAARSENDRLREAIRVESDKRSVAETRNERIPQLEALLAKTSDESAKTVTAREATISQIQTENTGLRERLAETETQLDAERKAAAEKLALLAQAEKKLSDAFDVLASKALRDNNESFLKLAKTTLEKFQEGAQTDLSSRQKAIDQLVKPLQESLRQMEEARNRTYAGLSEQVKSLALAQTQLQKETGNLVTALRAPKARGSWGEIQLRRVVEMAGMVKYCDFVQEETVATEAGPRRADLIVRLPNNQNVVVDAKTPLQAYLEALEAPDEDRRQEKLKQHARQVRARIAELSKKTYWDQFKPTPEFVVLFLPGENFFGAALEQDPSLIECGVEQKVVLATPTTLIALLLAVAHGWRHEKLAKDAQRICDLGKDLYERIGTFAKYFSDTGKYLGQSVSAYNEAAASLEARLLVTARRFKELGASAGKDIETVEALDHSPRALQAEELLALPNAASASADPEASDATNARNETDAANGRASADAGA